MSVRTRPTYFFFPRLPDRLPELLFELPPDADLPRDELDRDGDPPDRVVVDFFGVELRVGDRRTLPLEDGELPGLRFLSVVRDRDGALRGSDGDR